MYAVGFIYSSIAVLSNQINNATSRNVFLELTVKAQLDIGEWHLIWIAEWCKL